jgi:hypothetical protein
MERWILKWAVLCFFLPFPSYSEENDVVPKVVEAILSLPENTHMAVRHTSVLLLGELCEWIERHPQSLGKYNAI